ncbi:nitronate monooxygenase [Shouchella sp. 1P09AA]|uniref:NAD(P)H-dependent flavin oxidoreductase n=1 Tax=unclassified Shouchella TaxID=2893065 RepID=UPI0039A2CCE5
MVTRLLNIQYPIIQGGMGNISDPILVAAVSEAGGLGTIGCGTLQAMEVKEKIVATRKRTTKPFALNIPLAVNEDREELINLAINEAVPVVSLSAGNPQPFISRLKQHGITVICVVATVKQGRKAEEAGADLLVAEGFEAAGINAMQEMTTLTLIPQLVERVQVPVVAAGGIGNGKGLAAVLMLGAVGAQMGTRFIATQDAPYSQRYKEKLLNATDQSTLVLGRAHGQVRRVLKGVYTENLHKHERHHSASDYQIFTSEDAHKKGAIDGNDEQGFMNGGQVAGLINDLPTVKDLLDTMIAEAKAVMQEKMSLLD